jgi:hypothetical protein
MRHFFILFVTLSVCHFAHGQERTLKSDVVLENKQPTPPRSSASLNVMVNNNKCRFEQMALRKTSETQTEMEFTFQRPCDGNKTVSLLFPDLQEALEVKNLLMSNPDFSAFNLIAGKEKHARFEIIYK